MQMKMVEEKMGKEDKLCVAYERIKFKSINEYGGATSLSKRFGV